MPFSLISTVLGGCFALVWIFIGAMLVRDSQFALRRDRESDTFSHTNLPATRGQRLPSLTPALVRTRGRPAVHGKRHPRRRNPTTP